MSYTLYTSTRNTDNSCKHLNVNLVHASRKCYTRNSERKKAVESKLLAMFSVSTVLKKQNVLTCDSVG